MTTDKLTIDEVNTEIEYLERPAAHIVRKDALKAFQQLADTMRENECLRNIINNTESVVMAVHTTSEESGAPPHIKKAIDDAFNAVQSYKQSETDPLWASPADIKAHERRVKSILKQPTKTLEAVNYHTTDGRTCTITIPEGSEGRIINGVLQVLSIKTTGAKE